jgi:hypothetical protein
MGGSGTRRYAARRAILPQDPRQDPAFAMDFEWRDRPAYEPCPRRRSGLRDEEEYDYDATADAPPQHVPWPSSSPQPEEVEIPVEE